MIPEVLFFLFIVAQLADLYTTKRAIAAGGAEKNPVVALFMRRFGANWAWIKFALSAAAGAALYIYGQDLALGIAAAVIFAVALWNEHWVRTNGS